MALGSNLGSARGSITIDTSQAQQAPGVMQNVAQGINRAMSTVGTSVNQAQGKVNAFAGTLRDLGGALGISFGAAGVVQLGKMAIAAAETATAYERQSVAARSLAGSQQQLNELMEAYNDATGHAVDQATALADVTRLQAIGFGDSAEELERFVRAARGISLATGQSQDYVIQQLQLAIANQSTMRLDQIGLGVAEVKNRVAELRMETRGLSQEMAYQQAILELSEEKFGELTESQAAQATGIEKARKAAKDYGLLIGQIFGPGINMLAGALSGWFTHQIEYARGFAAELEKVIEKLREIGLLGRDLSGSIASRTTIGRVTPTRMQGTELTEGFTQGRLDWARGITDINNRLHREIIDQERDYGRQRADTVEEYQQSLIREAQDFALNRVRQEQDLNRSIADIRDDAVRNEQRMAEDLARSIAQMQADSGERIASAREDTNERLLELEQDYARQREDAAADHRDKLLSAAGRLDAIAILEERKRYARQQSDAKEAHNEQRSDLREQLQERIDDESKALAKSIRQQQEAHDRQLQEARDNDARRIADMQADFEERQRREDEDRAIRLQRMAEDRQDQLNEMDLAHRERIAQITRHADEERAQLDIAHQDAMVALGVRNQAWINAHDAREKRLEQIYDAYWNHILRKFQESVPPGHPSSADPYIDRTMVSGSSIVLPASGNTTYSNNGRSLSFGDINIMVTGTTNMGRDELRAVLVEALEEIAGG